MSDGNWSFAALRDVDVNETRRLALEVAESATSNVTVWGNRHGGLDAGHW